MDQFSQFESEWTNYFHLKPKEEGLELKLSLNRNKKVLSNSKGTKAIPAFSSLLIGFQLI